jgi:hypothetical protein
VPAPSEYRVEIVNARGERLSEFRPSAGDDRAAFAVAKGLPRGLYFVRLYSGERQLLREYGQID